MNILAPFCTLLFAAAALFLPGAANAAPKSKVTIPGKSKVTIPSKAPAASKASFGERDGIIFKDFSYTVLTVKATSSWGEAELDHTVKLRFHRDSKKVDVRILTPGETWEGWGRSDSGTDYEMPTAPPADTYKDDKLRYEKARLHYTFDGANPSDGLQLHVVSVGDVKKTAEGKPTCTVKLFYSSYTESIGGGRRIFGYDFAEEAVIEGSDKKMGK